MERRTPTASDLVGLVCAFKSADDSLRDIREAGTYPIYPKAIHDFTGFPFRCPWHDTAYGRFPIQKVVDHPKEESFEEVSAVTRMECFSPGGLKSLFTRGTNRGRVNRALEPKALKPTE